MKLLGAFLCILFILSVIPNQAQIPVQSISSTKNITSDIDNSLEFISTENFTHYEVQANLTWSTYPHVDVIEKVIFKNTYSVAFNEIHMHAWAGFYNKYVDSGEPPAFKLNAVVDASDTPLTYTLTEATTLKINLPTQLQPGETTTFILKFEENPPSLRDRYGYGTVHDKPIVSFGNWLPVMAIYENDTWTDYPFTTWGESFYAKSACFLVNITTSTNMVIAATGSFLGRLNIDSQSIWMWNATLTRDFTFSASRYFETKSIIHNGVNITSYYVSEDASIGQFGVTVGANALDCYGEHYILYPYDRVSIVETPMDYGGMEYPMLVQISDKTYSSQGYFEIVTAHELGHQWWAYLSGNDPFKEPWLDEAFATYSEVLYTECTYGPSEALDYLHAKMNSYERSVSETEDFGIYHNMTWWEQHGSYGLLVYTKGSIVVSMLRYVMGDTAFFKAMHDYFKHYAFRIVHIPDFRKIMESHYNQSLDWFFNEWIYHGYRATFSIGDYDAVFNGKKYNVEFTIRQYFSTMIMPITIRITFSDSTTKDVRVWIRNNTEYYNLQFDKKPIKLELDPNDLILATYVIRTVNLNVTTQTLPHSNNNTGTLNNSQILSYIIVAGTGAAGLIVLIYVLRKKELL